MRYLILTIALLATVGLVSVAGQQQVYAQETDYVKKFSDYVNTNSGWLFWTAVGLVVLGLILMFTVILALLGYPLLIVGVIVFIVLLLNWLFISPIVHS